MNWYDPLQEKKGGPLKFERDGYLKDHEKEIKRRYGVYEDFLAQISKTEGGLDNFSPRPTAGKEGRPSQGEGSSLGCSVRERRIPEGPREGNQKKVWRVRGLPGPDLED